MPPVSTVRLTQTSYALLGMVEMLQPITPYDLKRFGEGGLFQFWSIPHTQVYSECARLSQSGHLDEVREQVGRRRRVFRLTSSGREALDAWRGSPATEIFEVRDEGMLKLYFGTDQRRLAETQIESHARRLELLETLHAGIADTMPAGMRAALEVGTRLERDFVRLWTEIRDGAGGEPAERAT